MKESYEFTDFSSDTNGDSTTNLTGGSPKNGCHVSTAMGFLLALVAILIAVGVGLTVHFASPAKNFECQSNFPDGSLNPTPDAEAQWQVCKELAANKDHCMVPDCPGGSPAPSSGATTTTAVTSTTTAMATTTTPSKPTDDVNMRLPRALTPVNYKVKLEPQMYEGPQDNFTFKGSVKIFFECTESTSNITLHINMLTISSYFLTAADGTAAPIVTSFDVNTTTEFLIFKLDSYLTVGSQYNIDVNFTGHMKNDLLGLYYSSYQINNNTEYLVTSQLQTTYARKVFPCFDEPGLKATFDITLVRRTDYSSISNMPRLRSEDLGDNRVADVFNTTEKMSTYLLAFIVSKMANKTAMTPRGIEVGVWAPPHQIDQADYALKLGVDILDYYEKYYDIPYPLPKLDMAAVPDFAFGGMENWGLVIYRESALLYDPSVSSSDAQLRVARVVAHELAHQWFGDLVTPEWWDDIWLNEGFASYVEKIGMDHAHPEWKIIQRSVVEQLHNALKLDGLKSSHPIYVPVNSPDEINEIFDSISYDKGASILSMLKHYLGEETFNLGVKNYLIANQFGSADHEELWDALDNAVQGGANQVSVKEIMNTWILQMNYPVVTVTRSRDNAIKISQSRFLLNKDAEENPKYPSPYGYKWEIPFSYTSSLEKNFDTTRVKLMRRNAGEEEIQDASSIPSWGENSWVIGNIKERGFYRVNYDNENWQALLKQLEDDHTVIATENRAQLINDVWNFAKAEITDPKFALDVVKYLENEQDYTPWRSAATELSYVTKMLRRSDIFGKYQEYISKLVNKQYQRVGWDTDDNNALELSYQSLILSYACNFGVTGCSMEPKRLFAEWMTNETNNPVPPDLKSVVYCTAISEGGVEEWDFAYRMYKETNVAAERNILEGALACTSQSWLLSRYLRRCLDPNEIRKQDAVNAIGHVASNNVGQSLAWDFVRGNWQEFKDRYADSVFLMASLISSITAGFNTEFDLAQVRYFVEKNPDFGSGQAAVNQALENIATNIKWMKKMEPLISDWLEDQAEPEPEAKVDVRLPLYVYPLHYDLELTPDIYGNDSSNFTFEGHVKIKVNCREATNNISIHVNKLDLQPATINGIDGCTTPQIMSEKQDTVRQFLVITFVDQLVPNCNYTIDISFTGPLKDDLAGLYLSSYKRENETVHIATTQFQPTDARKAFPCFDEPAIKATFKVTLLRKPPMVSLSNMLIEGNETRPNDYVADMYQVTPKMSTYLLAFIICDFAYKENTTKEGTLYRVWARPEAIDQADYALDVGVRILDYFEEFFNVSYPLPKQDMIAIPDFGAGAMENWGLITYRETAMLYDPKVSAESNKQRVAVVVSHELAHQWFGNLVTPSWWDDLWLNEGFASYVEYIGVDVVEPSWKMFEQFVVADLQSVFDFDSLASSHPVYVPVSHPEEINEIFDRISYAKGASIIRMMRFFLGDETFRKGLTRYLTRLQYDAAFHDDLWQALSEQSTEDAVSSGQPAWDVKAIMDTWTLQMNYPVVTLNRTGQGTGSVIVTQDRFLWDKNSPEDPRYPSKFGYRWDIPLTIVSNIDKNFDTRNIFRINGTEENRVISNATLIPDNQPNTWIIGNAKQYGYYRVNYDLENWNSLINQLNTDHTVIDPINRAQIINDAWNLAKAGLLDITIALDTVGYLQQEESYVPWSAAVGELNFVDVMLSKTSSYGSFSSFMKNLAEGPYNRIGWTPTPDHLTVYVRGLVFNRACSFGIQDCIDNSKMLFKKWMDDPSGQPVDPDLKSFVYCTAIREGGAAEWDFAYEQYKLSDVASEKSRLLASMACSKDIWILNRYLDRALMPEEIRKQDAVSTMRYVSSNSIGRFLVWDFVTGNWDLLLEDYGGSSFSFSSLIGDITSSFNTEADLRKLEQFMSTHPNQGSGARAFVQAVEKTKGNIQWMEKNFDTITDWLKDKAEPEPEAKVDVRLPLYVYPLHYDLELTPDIYGNDSSTFMFEGHVKITVNCREATNNISIHVNKLDLQPAIISGIDGCTMPQIISEKQDTVRQFLVITFVDQLVPNCNYTIDISFTGPLKDDLAGLYLSSYKRDNNTVHIATTQFQPTDARKAFPCFDEPAIKATFKVTLLRKTPMVSLSNMLIERNETRTNGYVADVYQMTPKMSTYLLAFIICDFAYKENRTQGGTLYRVWARPEAIDQADYALDVGVRILDYFEEFFNVPYPLPKQDMIAIPDFGAGAMENWGLITYRETAMLYDPKVSAETNKQRVAVVVSHELAHQWFGNLVTPSWWDDLWLNEGFASYVEYIGVDVVEPSWKMFEQFVVEDLQSVFNFDSLASSHPVYVPVSHPDEINEIFDRISYAKGASIIRMMRFFLGDETFRKGLTRYLTKLQYDAAFHDDLWQALSEQSTEDAVSSGQPAWDVKAIMDTWTLQMNYPVVTLNRTGQTTGSVRVSQDRFLWDKNSPEDPRYPSKFGYRWDIPLTIVSNIDKNFDTRNIFRINGTEENPVILDLALIPDNQPNTWIIGNAKQYGYYRVNYDLENWNSLINQLNTDHTVIDPINRAQIINDAWNLAKAGLLDITVALDTVGYLQQEESYVPWSAAVGELNFVDVMLSKTASYGSFSSFMKNLAEGPYNRIGWTPTPDHLTVYVRGLVFNRACSFGIQDCIDNSKMLFKKWMDDPSGQPVDPDLKSFVYCTAIREGGAAEWDFAYEQYKLSDVASEKSRLLSSMACSKDIWILNRYLDRALMPEEIRKQDAVSTMRYVSSNSIGRFLVWDFVTGNWDLLLEDYGGSSFSFSSLIGDITSSFNTEADLRKLEQFMSTHPNQGSGARAFVQAVEKTKGNIQWMEKNFDTITDWLKDKAEPELEAKVDVRLPLYVYPLHYDLELTPDIYGNDSSTFMFEGRVKITVNCREATNNISIHVNKLDLQPAIISGIDGCTTPQIISEKQDTVRQFLVITFVDQLVPNCNYTVDISFTGPLKDDLAGLYLSSYKRDNNTVHIATTQFQPTDARKAFPCFDEPAIKATFKVTLLRKTPMVSLSNMLIERNETRTNGYVADVYQMTPKMSTYLLAFIICDFAYKENRTQGGTLYRVWARPEAIDQADYALDVGVRILDYFEEFFNVPYPLPKQDMIAIPDFGAGAMENWGLITYRETAMLYDPKVSAETNKQRVAVVVSHELAHQWFGNLVTPSWWDDLWLNEGFASYVEYIGVDVVEPSWKMFEQFVVEDLQSVFNFDSLASSHPVYVPVSHPDEINEIFDRISYAKGASIIRMMRFFLGDETFRKGLTRYLTKLQYDAAFHDDLWQALSEQSTEDAVSSGQPAWDVKAIMDTWTLQMNYPVVTLNRTGQTTGSVRVSQDRFLWDKNSPEDPRYPSKFGYRWDIPLTIVSNIDKNFDTRNIFRINGTEENPVILDLALIPDNQPNTWIIGNAKQYGYYRVNYDLENWNSLINQLNTDHTVIDPINRAQIINDAWNLAKAGLLDITVALDTVGYLQQEESYVPWSAAVGELNFVDVMLSKTASYGSFSSFMKNLAEGPYNRIGWTPTPDHLTVYVRGLVFNRACSFGIQDCIDNSKMLFKKWMDDPSGQPVDPDLKSFVYCTAIREGGAAEWDFAYEQYKLSDVASEKSRLLSSMACSKDIWILNRYLDRALMPEEIRKQDAVSTMRYVSSNSIGRFLVWDFVTGNWDLLLEDYGGSSFSFSSLIGDITSSFNTEADLRKLEQFMSTHPNQGSGARAFVQAVEKTKGNIQWMEKNFDTITDWLKDKAEPEPEAKVDVRLPLYVYPLHYDLELTPDIYGNDSSTFMFEGHVKITVNCREATNNISIHVNKLDLQPAIISGIDGCTMPQIISEKQDTVRQFLVITFVDQLVPNCNYTIDISFTGPLKDDLAGLYLSSYKRDNNTVHIATTQFQPTDARKAFPCFDEPAIKATFKVTLLRKTPMVSLSNMLIERNETRTNGYVADVYQMTPKMSTYLLAFIICDFAYKENRTQGGTLYRVWARPEAIDQADYALDVGVRILDYFEEFFNVPYPLPKQDMIAIPDFGAGAMENWGLITYRETAMLYDPKVSAETNKQRVAVIVSHELAHQWFGNLVTPSWWDDLWLNEGFASYVEYIGVDVVEPSWKMFEQFVVEDLQSVFNFDSLASSHPVYVPVSHPDEINEIFDRISYAKGASIIRMMRFFLGDETFRKGLTRYLTKLQYDAAFHDDLWQALSEQSTEDAVSSGQPAWDVKAIMDTWTLQMNYPVVTLNRTGQTTGSVRVSQDRFLWDKNSPEDPRYPSKFGYRWDIPLTIVSNIDKNFDTRNIFRINGTEENPVILDLALIPDNQPNTWIIGNAKQYGYYRVNYDLENWNSLINQLNTDHTVIDPINRAQIINDAWNLAKAGLLDITVALDTVGYLQQEESYVPWSAAVGELNFVDVMLSKTASYGSFSSFMKNLAEGPYNRIGWTPTPDHLTVYVRGLVFNRACSFGIQDCIDNSKMLFKKWMDDPSGQPVDPDLKSFVYCTAIREGGAAEWDFAYEQYKLSDVASEKSRLLSSMACSKDIWILNRYLDRALMPEEIRKQDAVSTMRYVSSNSIGRFLVWDFVTGNWDLLLEDYGGSSFSFSSLIGDITSSFNTEADLRKLEQFMSTHPNQGSGARAFVQAVEKTKGNIQWMEKNFDTITDWLKDKAEPELEAKVDVRLPLYVYPLHYDLELTPDIYGNDSSTFMFEGRVKITVNCREATNNISIHVNKLDLQPAIISGIDGCTTPQIISEKQDTVRQFLVITFVDQLVPNCNYTIDISFTGPLKDDLAGLYLSSYKRDNNTVHIATTQFQPTDARKAFPCFDEPAIKATFKVTLLRKTPMVSLSNMLIERNETRTNGYVADVYQMTPKMSTYLLAFIICDFAYKENRTQGGTLYRVWARPEAIDQADYALDVGVRILDYFEEFFNVPYPLPKQDMIAIPDFGAGAMENWGLITYRETAMLYDPKVSAETNKQRVAVVVSHELAHQWFGNLVTPSWWDDLWLNEGFASYVEYIGVDVVEPSWKMFEQFVVEDLQSVFNFDSLASSHPVYVPVSHPDEINEIFDRISYAKGASIIRMMRFFLGDETFRKGLTRYLTKLQYDAAFHDDLWQALSEQSTEDAVSSGQPAWDVKAIMDTWTLQMNYPVVTLNRTGQTTGSVRVSQDRFLWDKNSPEDPRYPSKFGYRWDIPLTIVSNIDKNFDTRNIFRINGTEENPVILDLALIPDNQPNTWIIGNAKQYGYYRVNYDLENWNSLINQLNTDHTVIDPINRAQIINDAWNLAKAGLLDITVALDTVGYLQQEESYVPWSAAVGELNFVDVMLSKTASYGSFSSFMKNLAEGPYNRIGWTPTPDHLTVYVRGLVFNRACSFGIQDCIDNSKMLFKKWMDDPSGQPVDPDLKSFVYCTAIREGGAAEWDFAYEQYKLSDVASEKSRLLSSMACSKDIWILNRYLDRALMPEEIRKQDAVSTMRYVSSNSIGRFLVWDFVTGNWDLLLEDYGGSSFSFSSLIGDITSSFNTEADLRKLEQFMSTHPNQGSGARAFVQAVEKTKGNIQWMEKNFDTITDWLKDKAEPELEAKVDVRLPLYVYPLHYDLELTPDIYGNDSSTFMFEGRVKITVNCREATNNISIHVNKLDLQPAIISGIDGCTTPQIISEKQDTVRQFLVITFVDQLVPNCNYTVDISFTGPLKDDLAGLYLSSYKRDNNTVHIATTQFQPTDARKAFPCFDEPAIKATFKVTLLRKTPMVSLSNMLIERNETRTNGYVADVYQMTPKMSTYLLAFIICDFAYKENRTQGGTLYRVWARPEAIDQADYALDVGVRILDYFEEFFNVPYPLPKQDMIAIPDFGAGAMENWGLITYRETAMLYDPKVSAETNKQRVAVVVSHELAHQWFGNLVTPSWWDDLWLNEGFASYVEYIGVDVVEPSWKMFEQFVVEDLQSVFNFDSLASSHPVYVPVSHPDEINEIFDRISYAKGASIIRMMRFFLGDETFRKGLTRYLTKLQYDAAFHDDLWQALSEQSAEDAVSSGQPAWDVKAIMDTWTLQMNYPVVTLNRTGQTMGSVMVSQDRFLWDKNSPEDPRYPSKFGYRWDIPLTIVSNINNNFDTRDIFRINTTEENPVISNAALIPDNQPNTWIIGNAKQYGYYRVNYDLENWNSLINQLNTGHTVIDPINRAQIINDAWNLAKAGLLDLTIALDSVGYIQQEESYVPWSAAIDELNFVDVMLSKTASYGAFSSFMKNLVEGPYNRIGWTPTTDHLTVYTRGLVFNKACSFGVQDCVRNATKLFREWMDDPSGQPVHPDLKSFVYCTAIREGGPDEWDFAYEQYKLSDVASEKSRLLASMACSNDIWILYRYLDRALMPEEIRKQDAVTTMRYVSRNSIGRFLVWDFVTGNWDLLLENYGGSSFSFSSLIGDITSSFNTEADLSKLEQFMSTHPNQGSGARAFVQAVEKTKGNIQWMEKNFEIIKEWLNNRVFS